MVVMHRAPSGAPVSLYSVYQPAYGHHPRLVARLMAPCFVVQGVVSMFKVTPNPPDTDPASLHEPSDSENHDELVKRALDFYANPAAHAAVIKATPRQLDSMFIVNPQ